MSKVDEYPEVKPELEAVARRCGCELLHLDFESGRLRLVLDSPDGVNIEDCARVSREASTVLDVIDFGSNRYTLEVSSPGLDREFYRDEDYERFTGSLVKVTWIDPATSAKRTDVGVLSAYHAGGQDGGSIEVETDADDLRISLGNVRRTCLEPVV